VMGDRTPTPPYLLHMQAAAREYLGKLLGNFRGTWIFTLSDSGTLGIERPGTWPFTTHAGKTIDVVTEQDSLVLIQDNERHVLTLGDLTREFRAWVWKAQPMPDRAPLDRIMDRVSWGLSTTPLQKSGPTRRFNIFSLGVVLITTVEKAGEVQYVLQVWRTGKKPDEDAALVVTADVSDADLTLWAERARKVVGLGLRPRITWSILRDALLGAGIQITQIETRQGYEDRYGLTIEGLPYQIGLVVHADAIDMGAQSIPTNPYGDHPHYADVVLEHIQGLLDAQED